jgi:hypothetical protein
MRVKVYTQGPHKSLNDQWLQVQKVDGNRVTIKTQAGFGNLPIDFKLSEVMEMEYEADNKMLGLLEAIRDYGNAFSEMPPKMQQIIELTINGLKQN